jgi:hypothetical protein
MPVGFTKPQVLFEVFFLLIVPDCEVAEIQHLIDLFD